MTTLNSTNIGPIVESAWMILTQKREALRDAKNDLNTCKINLAEFEKREKEINEWDWLLDNGVENPLAVVSQNTVYVDREHGLMFMMGNPNSFLSSLKEDEMIMSRTENTFDVYVADEVYFSGPMCLREGKFFNIPKFNMVRLAWGEAMNQLFKPDFRITRKVI